MDSICYHAGGPLTIGDIEDVAGDSCVKCPWHNQPIRLSDGARMYRKVTFEGASNKMVHDDTWRAYPKLQRVHAVEIREGGVYVKVDEGGEEGGEEWKSDKYCRSEEAARNLFRKDGCA